MPGTTPGWSLGRARVPPLAVACALFTLPALLAPAIRSRLYLVMGPERYLAFHNLAELFSVATALSIFAFAWFTHGQARDRHALFLGCTFLVMGLGDLLHTLGYAGMPAFFTPNSADKSTQIWIAVRLFSAVAFLVSAGVRPDSGSPWLRRAVLLPLALAAIAALFTAVTFFSGALPAAFVAGEGFTPFMRGAEHVVVALFALGAIAYGRRAARTGDPLMTHCAAALGICAAAELLFSGSRSPFDTYNLVGHAYRIAAFALFFEVSFVASVQRPRRVLQAQEEALRREVVERRAAEEERRRSEVKFGAFADAADQVFWIQRLRPGAILYVNPAFERVYGLTAAALERDPEAWQHAVHPDDWPALARAFAAWLAGGGQGAFDARYRIVRPDGGTRWIADRGFVLERGGDEIRLVGGVASDITQRMEEEAAVRESERRFREVLDGMLEGCMLVGFDFVVRYVNESAARQVRRSPAAVLGREMREVYPGLEATPIFPRLRRCMEERVPQRVESPFTFADGGTSWFEISVEPVAEGILVLSLDVTERRKTEDQLRQSQKLEAIGRLAGGVAHDFNNLLTVIVGGCGELRAALPEVPRVREEVEGIEEAARRAAALTRQLLSFSRRQIGQPRIVDLGAVVDGIDRMLRRLIGEDVELTTTFGASCARVRADPGQLEQVIVNLAVNARDAMPGGGRLTLSTFGVLLGPDDPEAWPGGLRPGRYVALAVRDSGCGMTPEVQGHLFEPFFTTKEVGRGTGLGLSTVYGIVKQAGGAIRVRSAPGEGSVFEVLLPLAEAPEEVAAESRRANAPRSVNGSERLLLVEDDPAVRAHGARALRGAGYAVIEAADGAEAVRVAARAGAIALLVTDVVMPNLGGPDLAARLRERRPGLPVVFVSGYTEHRIDLGRDGDRAELLLKPFTADQLLERVRRLLDLPRASAGAGPAGSGAASALGGSEV